MNNNQEQKIKEQPTFSQKEVEDAINSLDWMKLIEEIGKRYSLNENDIDNLKTETLLVLTGLEDGGMYAKNIENEVGTTKEDSEKIADEADEKIFMPIYNKFTENIKNSEKVKNADGEQNLNFILSGGDYSHFMEQKKE